MKKKVVFTILGLSAVALICITAAFMSELKKLKDMDLDDIFDLEENTLFK